MDLNLRVIAQGCGIADGMRCTDTSAVERQDKDLAADQPADDTLAIEAPTQAPTSNTGSTIARANKAASNVLQKRSQESAVFLCYHDDSDRLNDLEALRCCTGRVKRGLPKRFMQMVVSLDKAADVDDGFYGSIGLQAKLETPGCSDKVLLLKEVAAKAFSTLQEGSCTFECTFESLQREVKEVQARNAPPE